MGLAYVQLRVLIDTYSHEKLIAKAINSVLEQDYPDAHRQVIVEDDGSTDHTAEIVRTEGAADREETAGIERK
jgi:glycosyltransferase involved in cell wall biosynthesis